MTAIGGIWGFGDGRDVDGDCARILTAQSVYGLHGEARWSGGDVALGRRLWRLLPEDRYDAQPLRGAEGRFVLVADLRLDNREELAAELGLQAPQLKQTCDAALLLAAFERWDAGCCGHLTGDYAFCLWDAQERRMVLARDMLGSRPLHYHRAARFFAFASMAKGLHALADIPRAANEAHVAAYLAGVSHLGSGSFFAGIERVEPGQIVTVSPDRLLARRHWEWRPRRLGYRRSEDYVEAMRHHLEQAVRSQLRGADGRVGAHLSGGLDSSGVAATAARQLAPSGGKLIAFTAAPRRGYDGPVSSHWIADEGPRAAATAAMYPNVEHVVVDSSRHSPLDMFGRQFYLFERPVADLSNLVWFEAINQEVQARGLTVLLTGQLGNLTLSYDGGELLAELVRAGHWFAWARTMAASLRRRRRRLRGGLYNSFAPWLPKWAWKWFADAYCDRSSDPRRYSAIHPDRLREGRLGARCRAEIAYEQRVWGNGVERRLGALSFADFGNYNKGFLAGWGIDTRDPTADRRLVEFCLSVPTAEYERAGLPRALARAALADRLPPAVVNELRRGLQCADWHEKLTAARPQIADEISRLEQLPAAARVLDLARLRNLVDNWPTEGWDRNRTDREYRCVLSRGIAAGDFLRRAAGANA